MSSPLPGSSRKCASRMSMLYFWYAVKPNRTVSIGNAVLRDEERKKKKTRLNNEQAVFSWRGEKKPEKISQLYYEDIVPGC